MIAAAREVLQQLGDVEGRISIGRFCRVGAIDLAVVAIQSPAIERGGIVVAGFLAVAQVPSYDRVELGAHRGALAIRHKQPVDQAGRLLAGIGRNGIVFRAIEFNFRGRRARGNPSIADEDRLHRRPMNSTRSAGPGRIPRPATRGSDDESGNPE